MAEPTGAGAKGHGEMAQHLLVADVGGGEWSVARVDGLGPLLLLLFLVVVAGPVPVVVPPGREESRGVMS